MTTQITSGEIELGLDLVQQLIALYTARKANPGLEQIGNVTAEVDRLVGIVEKRLIEGVSYTEAERDALLSYIGVGIIAPPPPPPSAVVDPTTVEYDTEDEAKQHVTDEHPNVIKKDDGKFIVWPQIGPYPGKIVYTKP